YWFDVETLEHWEQLIADALRRGHADELVAGEHCGYCPVRSCPVMRQQLAMFTTDSNLEITAENVIQLHFLRQSVEARCGDLAAAIKHYVGNHGPVPTGD